jgi:hypothetical protein
MTGEHTEGWGVIRPGDRKAHYYRDTMSLCRRVGFYRGPLDPDGPPSPDDHAECRRLLAREKIGLCDREEAEAVQAALLQEGGQP